MDKKKLIEKIKNGEISKETFDQSKLINWINALPGTSTAKNKPSYNKCGDVYMHPIFQHPYILLKSINNEWLCTLLTSDSECMEILEKCESRFFNNNYITKVLFTVNSPVGSFCNVYENKKQLKKILKKLSKILK